MAGKLVTNPNGTLPDTGAVVTIDVVAAAGTFTRTAGGSGSFITDGFLVDRDVTFYGFTNPGNNVTKKILTVSATVITVTDVTGLVNENGSGNERVQDSTGSFFRSCAALDPAQIPDIFAGYHIDVYVTNSGDADLNVTGLARVSGIDFDAIFPEHPTLPFVLSPGENVQLKLRFFPRIADVDTLLTDTIQITHSGNNSVYSHTVAGWCRHPGKAQLSMSPSSWSFNWVNSTDHLTGTLIGEFANVFNLLLINSGDKLLTIDGVSIQHPFHLAEPFPTFPMALAPLSSAVIHIKAFAEIIGLTVYDGVNAHAAFSVVSNAGDAPDEDFVALITGITITSVNTVAGGTKPALAAFGPIIRRFDPTDLAPERPAKLVKVFDMGRGRNEKLLARVLWRYEDLGVASFNSTVKTQDETPAAVTKAIGTVAADSFIRSVLVDHQLNERLFELTVDFVSGPLSFVDCFIDYEPRGPIID